MRLRFGYKIGTIGRCVRAITHCILVFMQTLVLMVVHFLICNFQKLPGTIAVTIGNKTVFAFIGNKK